MHWNVSEGNIDVISSPPDNVLTEMEENDQDQSLEDLSIENLHLMTTVNHYKNKIEGLKSGFGHLFQDPRVFKTVDDDNVQWKQFRYNKEKTTGSKETVKVIHEPEIVQNYQPPSFEDTMITDTIRAIRRDKKEAAKTMSSRSFNKDKK